MDKRFLTLSAGYIEDEPDLFVHRYVGTVSSQDGYVENRIEGKLEEAAGKEAGGEREGRKGKEEKRKKGEEEPEPTTFLSMDVYAPSAMDVYDYITLSFTEPIASFNDTALHVRQKVDTLWQDVPFDIMRDSLDLKQYNLYADWKPGESYAFEVDSTAFHGLYGLFTDKVKKEFTVKKLEEYGQIFFNITGADSLAFVELLDTQDKVVRTVPVVEGKADFYYLNPGNTEPGSLTIQTETACGIPVIMLPNASRKWFIIIRRCWSSRPILI